MPEPVTLSCHRCSELHEVEGPVPRSALCSACGVELRCCMNCRFYDSSAYNDCSEPAADRVVEKDKANFCDYFSAGAGSGGTKGRSPDAAGQLEGLFKK
ncbi:MAG: hypothetical protein VB852_00545 [Deltaproteobacteria bacterium]